MAAGRHAADGGPPRSCSRDQRPRARARRPAAAGRHATGTRPRDGALSERALVLLSRAQCRAGGSDLAILATRTFMTRMPRVLLFATTTGYQTRAFGDAAERLGVELVFATDRCHLIEDPWQDQAIPIRFHDEAASVAAILAVGRRPPVDGLLVVGDRPTVIAARVSGAPRPAVASAGGRRGRTAQAADARTAARRRPAGAVVRSRCR